MPDHPMPDHPPTSEQTTPDLAPAGRRPLRSTRRRFLVAAAALPLVGAAPIVVDRIRRDGPDGELELRLTSIDGRHQAYADPLPEGASIYAPGGRRESTIVIRDQLTDTTRTLTLDRNLEPEAFSPDGATLYAIDHMPAENPVVYRVSTVDIAAGTVGETLGPLKEPLVDEMRGSGRQQVWSPHRDQLYTLYIRQYHNHAVVGEDGVHDHSEVHATDAFVHVLDVATDWALCVDLPEGFGLGPANTTGIMIDDGGSVITVVDHALGMKVEVTRPPLDNRDPGAFTVSELMPID